MPKQRVFCQWPGCNASRLCSALLQVLQSHVFDTPFAVQYMYYDAQGTDRDMSLVIWREASYPKQLKQLCCPPIQDVLLSGSGDEAPV